MGKAKSAAIKIFSIIDKRTKITALNSQKEDYVPSTDKFIGEIEFKDVWFRYPTRKNDWVL